MGGMGMLPEECISRIISFTSPMDACRSCLVSHLFTSAADSDLVWDRFLPHDHLHLLSNSDLAPFMGLLSKKKKLFFRLSDNPVLVGDDRDMSFAIDKRSGKKCYMIGARRLSIAWEDTSPYWKWISVQGSRFAEVVELNFVWKFEIKGRIETNILSQNTTYAAYLVYKLLERSRGFDVPIKVRVHFEGQEEANRDGGTCTLVFEDADHPPQDTNLPRDRGDGWKEVEIGEFDKGCGDDGVVLCSLMDYRDGTKRGLIVEGIEFRPKA